MRVAIIEDDPRDRDRLWGFLKTYGEEHQMRLTVDIYETGEGFRRKFEAGKYEILFFDNYIGHTLGIDLARKARELDPAVAFVFVTMTPDFAVDGYELRTLHYLMKPITPAGIEEIFRRWQKLNPSAPKVLEVMSEREPVKVPVDRIEYLETFRNLCLIHCDGREIRVHASLNNLMSQLPEEEFLRPHRSYALHMMFIARLEGQSFRMKSGDEIPISRRIMAECKRQYMEYLAHH